MGPVALLVFKTSEPANNGLVGSTPTRLRHHLCNPLKTLDNLVVTQTYTLGMKYAKVR